MVTKKQMKVIKNLVQKKYRNEHGLFVAEGIKIVNELLESGFIAQFLFCSSEDLASQLGPKAEMVSSNELKKMSNLQQNNGVLGAFEIPKNGQSIDPDWILVLDAVRDPGNLGTIIRLCDWFGIEQVVCSSDTVDCYNPKVLQATMGSIARVNILYTDLAPYLKDSEKPIFGAYMGGTNVFQTDLPQKGILVMGNEAHGISNEITSIIDKKISIPQFGEQTAESLNVAMATSILLSEIRR